MTSLAGAIQATDSPWSGWSRRSWGLEEVALVPPHPQDLISPSFFFFCQLSPSSMFSLSLPKRSLYYTFSHHYQGRIDFNTVDLFLSAGMDLACILGHGFCTPRPSGCKTHGRGKSLKISLDPRSLGSQEILVVGDGFSNTSLLLVEHGYSV